jgi:hemolysin activation/secretion protein
MRNLVKLLFFKHIRLREALAAGILALAAGPMLPATVYALPATGLAATIPATLTPTSVPAFGPSPDVARVTPKLPAAAPAPAVSFPPVAPAAPSASDDTVAVSILQGLVFVPAKASLQADGVPVAASGDWRVAAQGLPLLDTVEFKQMMHEFIGKPFTLADAAKIRQQTNKWLADHDHPFVNATIPPQNVDNGVVQVVVVEYRLGRIDVVGARYFSKNTVRRMSSLRPGQVMTASQITQNANVMNSNPFLTPDINFREGSTSGTTDMEVKVTDRRPLRVYAGYDNQGVRSLGLDEFQLGINWGNVLDTGQVASYQYTRSFSGRYASHSIDDVIPLSAIESVQIFTNFSALSPKVADGFHNSGHNYNASIRYVRTLPFWSGGLSSAHLRLGYDYKYTDNNLLFIFPGFGSFPLLNSAAEVHQFPVIADGVFSDRYGQTAVENDLIYAPGRLTSRNNDAAFQTLTAGAAAGYVYDKLSITRTTRLPKNVTWIVRGIVQESNNILPYTEQLGGGGVGSVRGYYPDTALGSNGELLSTEIRLPAFSPGTLFGQPRLGDLAQLGVFYDYGALRSPKTVAGGQAPVDLAGAGFFIHYSVDRFVDIDFNYGWQLKHVPTEPPGLGHYAALAVIFSN